MSEKTIRDLGVEEIQCHVCQCSVAVLVRLREALKSEIYDKPPKYSFDEIAELKEKVAQEIVYIPTRTAMLFRHQSCNPGKGA